MPPVNDWKEIINAIPFNFVSDIFTNKTQNETTYTQEDCEDLGYAVVVDEDGDEIKNY
jgi:hypothetical protein